MSRLSIEKGSAPRLVDAEGKTLATIIPRRGRNRYIIGRLVCFADGRMVRIDSVDREVAIAYARENV